MKKGMEMANRCGLREDYEKSTYHILTHYDMTKELWTFLLAVFGVVCGCFQALRNLLIQ